MAAPVCEVGVDEGGRHSYLGQAEEDAHIFRPRVDKRVLLHYGGFCNGCIIKRAVTRQCISPQMCHLQ
jgi:hypothetical protein